MDADRGRQGKNEVKMDLSDHRIEMALPRYLPRAALLAEFNVMFLNFWPGRMDQQVKGLTTKPDPQDPHGRRRDLTSVDCLLASMYVS